MKTLALALAGVLALSPMAFQQAQAQPASQTQAAKKKATAAKKAPVHKAQPKKKTVVRAKKAPVKAKAPAAAAAIVPAVVAPLSAADLAVAPKVYTGQIRCSDGGNVTVTPDAQHAGYFHVAAEGHNYYMHPVVSQTGAVRMEDAGAGAVWLQLGNKSMLLDQRIGTRVADGCESKEQVDFVAHMDQHPAPDLLGLDKK